MNPGIDPYNLQIGTQIYVCDGASQPAAGGDHLGDEMGQSAAGTMNCNQTVAHTIKSGDSLWLIAQAHGTTVESIMAMNPGIDPYNLRVGTQIYVCDNMMTPSTGAGTDHLGGEMEHTMPDEGMGGSYGQAGQMATGGTMAGSQGQEGQSQTSQPMNGGMAAWDWCQNGQMMPSGTMAGSQPQTGQPMTDGMMEETYDQTGQPMTGGAMSENYDQNGQVASDEYEQPTTGSFGQGMMEGNMGEGEGQFSPVEDLPPTQIAPLPTQEEFPEANGEVWTQPIPERYVPEDMVPGYPEWAAGMMGGSGTAGTTGMTGGAGPMGSIGMTGGTGTMGPIGMTGGTGTTCNTEIQSLNTRMREVWAQHLYWIRMLMVSILGRLDDQRPVTSRVLQSPTDIMAVFAVYYPASDTRQIGQLLTNHVQDGASLATALRDGNRKRAEELNRNLYANSSQLADTLSDLNPYYNRKRLKDMLSTNIDRSNRQTVNRLAGNYVQDVKEFDKAEKEMMDLADYLSEGIFQQFYN